MSTCSQSRPDRGHEQFEEGCRSTALYSSSPRNRRTSSSVRKAGALVSPSSCLGEGPHGWVPVDTHSTPVPSSTGEAVGGLCSVRAQYTTRTRATRTFFFFFGNGRFFFGREGAFCLVAHQLMMREQTLISGFAARFDCYRLDIREDANTHKAIACKYLSNSVCTVVEECHPGYFCP